MRLTFASILLTAALPAILSADPKEDVLATMEAWRRATETKDAGALAKLLHPDLVYSHSDGKTETRDDVLSGLLQSGRREIVIHGPFVRVYGAAAIVKADVDFINRETGSPSVARLNVLHVLLETNEGWQLVARQSTRLAP